MPRAVRTSEAQAAEGSALAAAEPTSLRPHSLAAMIPRAPETNPFELVRVVALRAAQLMRGCKARVPESHRAVLTARREVAEGKVQAVPRPSGPLDPASMA